MNIPEQAVESIRRMADLPEGWDDESASVIGTHARAGAAEIVAMLCALQLGEVRPGPCADGSVDLHWKTDDAELLVNVTGDGSGEFYFRREHLKISGSFQAPQRAD